MSKLSLSEFFQRFQALHVNWVEINGCIVSSYFDSPKKQIGKMLKEGCSREQIEQLMNHIHMSMVLDSLESKNSRKLRHEICELYAAVIEYRLKKRFPDRKFDLIITEQKDETNLTYHQISNTINS